MTRAVVFDVGETLIDETRMWEQAADAAGVPRFTLMGVLGGLAARGERHTRAWTLLGVDQAASTWSEEDFYPDARPAIQALRSKGLRVAAVGNTPAATEAMLGKHLEVLGSSERWGVAKPEPEFFGRIESAIGLDPGRDRVCRGPGRQRRRACARRRNGRRAHPARSLGIPPRTAC